MADRILYLDHGRQLTVELGLTKVVVSWPGGFRTLTYEDPVTDLLGVLSMGFNDLLDKRPTKSQTERHRAEIYDEGFQHGWEAHQAHVDRQSQSGRGAMRPADPVPEQQGQAGVVADGGAVAI